MKIPGYDLLYPKSWETYGFARVLVYVKKTFEYDQVFDLQHDLVQSIWLRGGYKNSKKIYFCHGYREHSSTMGCSISDQKQYLSVLLQQWSDAVDYNQSNEPNEVHVCLDMNLDYLKENWSPQRSDDW